MATTHALAGAFLGAAVAVVAPEFASVAVVAGVAGSVSPDLDLYSGHRRTLHFPVYGWVAAVPAVGLALLSPAAMTAGMDTVGMATVGIATFLAGAALHATMDATGGGLELRPWEGGSDRAVYSHYHGRWLEPRRVVPYDGSARDLALAIGFAVLPALVLPERWRAFVAAALAVSVAYVALRKRLAACWAALARTVPAPVSRYVPQRFDE